MKTINLCAVGFPKSGNSLLALLIRDLINMSVSGFGIPGEIEDKAKYTGPPEGKPGPHRLYKHHSADAKELTAAFDHVFYVVRDPRDVAVSGAYYFENMLAEYQKSIEPSHDKFDAMSRTVVQGSSFSWCAVGWSEHVSNFLDSDAKIFRYDELMNFPIEVILRISKIIEVDVSFERAKRIAIENSFEVAQKRAVKAGREDLVQFMRSGKSGQWKNELSFENIRSIESACGEVMGVLGFEL